MYHVRPPLPIPYQSAGPFVFLAGTLDMGVSEDWQAKAVSALNGLTGVVLNPRRDAWDASWGNDLDDPRFVEQVAWELDGMSHASTIMVWFAPGSKSPVTMLELGLHARSGKVVVGCPPGFYRRGNIRMAGERYGFQVHESFDETLDHVCLHATTARRG